MKRCLAVLLFILNISSVSFAQQLLLQQGHTASVNDFAIDASGKRMASIASDRSLIFWTNEGTVLRRISIPSSPYYMDFSPDGTTLAVLTVDRKVYLIDTDTYETRSITRTGETNSLHYSMSIHYLPDGRILLSDYDSTVKLYSSDMSRIIRKFTFRSIQEPGPAVASPNGKWFAVVSERGTGIAAIELATGREINYIDVDVSPSSVSFTPDSKNIIIGKKSNEWRKYSFPSLTLKESHKMYADKTLVSSTHDIFIGGKKGLFRGHLGSESFTTISNREYASPLAERAGYLYFSVGDTIYRHDLSKGKNISFGKRFSYANQVDISPDGRYLALATYNYTSGTDGIPVVDLKSEFRTTTYMAPGELSEVTATLFSTDGNTLYALTFSGDIYQFSVPHGKLMRKVRVKKPRHDTLVQDPETGILVAGSTHGLMLYDKDLNFLRTIAVDPLTFVHKLSIKKGLIVAAGNDKYGEPVKPQGFRLDGSRSTIDPNVILPASNTKHHGNLRIVAQRDRVEFKTEKNNSLIFSLFISADNEAVAVTPDGYFTYSGESILGAISFVSGNAHMPISSFFDKLYRPDLLNAAFEGKDISEYASAININKLLTDKTLPPKVRLITQSGKAVGHDTTIRAELCDNGGGIGDITLYINGMPVTVSKAGRGLKLVKKDSAACSIFEHTVTLSDGENEISLMAYNKNMTIESNRDVIKLSYASGNKAKPDLHILTVAVNSYRDGDLKLSYSVPDAKAIADSFKGRGAKLFGKIIVHQLLDAQVTKAGMEKVFSEIGKKTGRDDVFVLFVAGHGITGTKDGAYYFIPYDFRYTGEEAVAKQGVSMDDFKGYLSNVNALKSIILLDTCNSGSFTEALASRGMVEKTAINKLSRAIGRATIVASSKSQVALEGYEGHGAFTWTMLDGLKGKAADNSGKITINGLATYVEENLPQITFKKWGFEQIPQKNLQGMDFPIGLR
jgi:WD40 repeat protein